MKQEEKLSGKDLIHIGVFAAIYFVLSFVGMFLAIIPICWILMPGIVAVLGAIPYMYLCGAVQKPGAIFLMGGVTGMIYYLTGQLTVMILLTFGIGCLAAELVRGITHYTGFRGKSILKILPAKAFWIISAWFFSPCICFTIPSKTTSDSEGPKPRMRKFTGQPKWPAVIPASRKCQMDTRPWWEKGG